MTLWGLARQTPIKNIESTTPGLLNLMEIGYVCLLAYVSQCLCLLLKIASTEVKIS